MEGVATLLDFLFAFGEVAALGFLAYGGWLASRCGRSFTAEGRGRFQHRHRRRARETPRISAKERPFA